MWKHELHLDTNTVRQKPPEGTSLVHGFWILPGCTEMLQHCNEISLSGQLWVNSFAKRGGLWCNKNNFPTRRLARGTGGTEQVLTP